MNPSAGLNIYSIDKIRNKKKVDHFFLFISYDFVHFLRNILSADNMAAGWDYALFCCAQKHTRGRERTSRAQFLAASSDKKRAIYRGRGIEARGVPKVKRPFSATFRQIKKHLFYLINC